MEDKLFTKVSHDAQDYIDDPTAFAVYVAIKRFGDWNTGENCYPSAKTIAQVAKVSRTLVFRKLRLLELNGWIKRVGRVKKSKVGEQQDSNLYIVTETGGNRNWTTTPSIETTLPQSTNETGVVYKRDGGSVETVHELDTPTDNHLPITNYLNPPSGYENRNGSNSKSKEPVNKPIIRDGDEWWIYCSICGSEFDKLEKSSWCDPCYEKINRHPRKDKIASGIEA